jgi:hypothetical protein
MNVSTRSTPRGLTRLHRARLRARLWTGRRDRPVARVLPVVQPPGDWALLATGYVLVERNAG